MTEATGDMNSIEKVPLERTDILKTEKETAIDAFKVEFEREPKNAEELMEYMVKNRPDDYKEKSIDFMVGPFPTTGQEVKSAQMAFKSENGYMPNASELEEFMTSNSPSLGIDPIGMEEAFRTPVDISKEQMQEFAD